MRQDAEVVAAHGHIWLVVFLLTFACCQTEPPRRSLHIREEATRQVLGDADGVLDASEFELVASIPEYDTAVILMKELAGTNTRWIIAGSYFGYSLKAARADAGRLRRLLRESPRLKGRGIKIMGHSEDTS